jgi:hypothetical protein
VRHGRKDRGHVKKISISLSNDVLDWVCKNKEDLKVSTFINKVLRERMISNSEQCSTCEGLLRVERRLEDLEKGLSSQNNADTKQGSTPGGRIKTPGPSPGISGELTTIRNVSAENTRAVMDELVSFMKDREVIDRNVVLAELFPRTRSSISNNINYWYNACRGILDHLIQRGYVRKIDRSKYVWTGGM